MDYDKNKPSQNSGTGMPSGQSSDDKTNQGQTHGVAQDDQSKGDKGGRAGDERDLEKDDMTS